MCWGDNVDGQTAVPTGRFSAIAAGLDHTCALRPGGLVTCWGGNRYGQLDAPGGRFTALSAGIVHSCALRMDGTVSCWGRRPVVPAPPLVEEVGDV